MLPVVIVVKNKRNLGSLVQLALSQAMTQNPSVVQEYIPHSVLLGHPVLVGLSIVKYLFHLVYYVFVVWIMKNHARCTRYVCPGQL